MALPPDPSDPDPIVRGRLGGPVTPVSYGGWRLEVRGDEVADLTYAGVALLRAIRPVVRDRDWNTVPVRVIRAETTAERLVVTLDFDDGEVGFDGVLTVDLADTGLTVDFTAVAHRACATNRVGLVLLHPMSEAGRPVTVEHSDGSAEEGTWPVEISPHQPFLDVAGFGWERDGVAVQVRLGGDVFETEDQRNWTDASFKTYSTPLSRPFPVRHRTGSSVHQTATVSIRDTVVVTDRVVGRMPPISVGASLYPPPSTLPAPAPYEAVLVELTGPEDRWRDLVARAAEQAAALGAGLDVRIVTDRPEAVSHWVPLLPATTLRVGVFDPVGHLSSPPLWRALTDAATASGTTAQLVGGTRAHFTELNRGLDRLPDDLGAVTFSLTPQMHAIEVPHLLDSLAGQRLVAENAVRLAAGRPVHVGPITLARRFNAVATSGPPSPESDAARATDPLLDTAFAAAWTLGSVAALAGSGVAGLCYHEAGGDRGLDGAAGPKPVGLLLGALAGWRDQPLLDVRTPPGLAAVAVLGEHDAAQVLVADLAGRARAVTVRTAAGTVVTRALASWGWARVGEPVEGPARQSLTPGPENYDAS